MVHSGYEATAVVDSVHHPLKAALASLRGVRTVGEMAPEILLDGQRPCYLLGEGYAKSFKELMEETDWDAYGTGNYEKCADCMVHSGYEATAVVDSVRHPLKAAMASLRRVRTEGEMAPEIALDGQRPAEYVFSRHVEEAMEQLGGGKRPAQSARRAS
jgi:hypothetical protein